jgi:hypothetical protein
MSLASLYAQTQTALEACLVAQARGAGLVEYEIMGRRTRRQDLAVAIRELRLTLTQLGPMANRESNGMFSLGAAGST